jgi:hypothetical protein
VRSSSCKSSHRRFATFEQATIAARALSGIEKTDARPAILARRTRLQPAIDVNSQVVVRQRVAYRLGQRPSTPFRLLGQRLRATRSSVPIVACAGAMCVARRTQGGYAQQRASRVADFKMIASHRASHARFSVTHRRFMKLSIMPDAPCYSARTTAARWRAIDRAPAMVASARACVIKA